MTPDSLFGADALSGHDAPSGAVQAETPAPSRQVLGPSTSLYRRYRPQSFSEEELVGQEAVVRTLRNAIRLDRLSRPFIVERELVQHAQGITEAPRGMSRDDP